MISEITRVVESLGHQAVVPSNYTDAMLKTAHHHPALFIIDVGSVEHEPWKLGKKEKVRSIKPISKIPILLASSSSLSEADTDLVMKLSIQGFFNLAKETATLAAEVARIMGT